jgi:hypothetical protein
VSEHNVRGGSGPGADKCLVCGETWPCRGAYLAKRWEWQYDGMWHSGEQSTEIKTTDDDYVLAADYDALERRVKALEAELAEARQLLERVLRDGRAYLAVTDQQASLAVPPAAPPTQRP